MDLDDFRRQQGESRNQGQRNREVGERLSRPPHRHFLSNDLPQILNQARAELSREGVDTTIRDQNKSPIHGSSKIGGELAVLGTDYKASIKVLSIVRYWIKDDTDMADWHAYDGDYYERPPISLPSKVISLPVDPVVTPVFIIRPGLSPAPIFLWRGPQDNERVAKALTAVLMEKRVVGDVNPTSNQESEQSQASTGCLVPLIIGFALLAIGACALLR